MTREEAKELLPIIQAFAEGKTIEVYYGEDQGWHTMVITNPKFDLNPSQYRIKPEPKYRPFKSKEECWNEMLKHQPFGWVKGKDGQYTQILTMSVREEENFDYWFKNFTFPDGKPFGIKE